MKIMLDRLRAQPVSRILLLVTVVVAVLPISVLGYYIYHSAWQNSWREIREKHQLRAENLAVPLSTYVNDQRSMLAMTAHMVTLMKHRAEVGSPRLLEQGIITMQRFKSLIQLDMKGHVIAYAEGSHIHNLENTPGLEKFANEQCYLRTRDSGEWSLSGVKRNPLTGEPTIFMGQPVLDVQGKMIGVLLGELQIDYIEAIRARVRFGKKGHSAIVDQTGHVIAHPNPQWMKEIRDLSSWPIVKDMMAGKTGVTKFYSPFIKADMVAGYASVPGIGWGIMVPQPESEVAAQVNELMRSHLIWASIGLLLAITLAGLLARWITRPLDRLASAGRQLIQDGSVGNLPEIRSNSPKEIRELNTVLRSLIAGLQRSREEVRELNSSLQERVDEATHQLRQSNEKLELLARRDSLTELANRRYFENSLSQALSRRSGDIDQVCVMLVDIDHFKQINDAYGHAAGDTVLSHIARVLERGMRSGDLVARYGGDEFVAYMRCSNEVGMQRAREIRESIDSYAIPYNGKNIHITVSIGLYCQVLTPGGLDVNKLLANADDAMYRAKKQGRNRVVDITH
ncbi:MAG: diguanylate cyclase [Gammaproteobacteria bacterium]|nr:diguanylate cyclase [Gammaproteobacteria bacterium]